MDSLDAEAWHCLKEAYEDVIVKGEKIWGVWFRAPFLENVQVNRDIVLNFEAKRRFDR
jgi:hypothetical protein